MNIYDPSSVGGDFTIYYGLGSPAPGKVAYVYVTEPNGYYHEVAEAENVPDHSQVAYLYAGQPGVYQFFYDYSYYSQGVGFTQVYEEDHYISQSNSAPSIEWYSAPGTAESNTQYTIQAHGWDNDGNLTQVNVWKNGNPFAFAGGGNGFNNVSGNPSTDSGPQDITYSADSVDSAGLNSGMIYHTVHINAPPNHAPSISWNSITPGSINHNNWYTVRADATDVDGNMDTINIYRNGNPFAFELNGNGSSAYSDNADYAGDPVGTTVQYMAEAGDAAGAWSGQIYCYVQIADNPPTGGWNPYDVGTVYINGQYSSTASASDEDGNLKEIRVYQSWYDLPPVGNYTGHGPYLYDTVTSTNKSNASRTYNWQADPLYQKKYVWTMIAEDDSGGQSVIWSISGGESGAVDSQNRQPLAPHLFSEQTTIQLGQSVTISGDGTDQDANAMYQYLWYQMDGETTWHAITTSSYSSGTGNTVLNYTFTPTSVGLYHFKTRVDDPYASSVDVTVDIQVDDVPPVTPQSLTIQETTPTWVYLAWQIPTPNNVTEEHVYWQPSSGGSVTDILLGNNVDHVSVTGLSPGTGYNFWVKTRNGFGTYSDSSTVVSATTPWEPPTITAQPVSQNKLVGQTVTFTVGVSAYPAPTYQWRKDGTAITGGTQASLVIPNLQRWNHGTYSVVVTNAGGTVYSNGAVLLVGVSGDTDGDGIPDSWETAHGLNPNDPNDALVDTDGDGLTNVAEYNLGLDPNVADTSKSALGGTIPAGWPTTGNATKTEAVGATAGSLSVDKSGALTYTVPIWVTPGTAGMQPQLALAYSSQGGAGIAGFGWSLTGISQITRGPQTRAVDNAIHGVDFTPADRFYLDGQRLIAISGADGADGTEYRTEIDSLTKVLSHGTPGSGSEWFEAWTKSGLHIEFGHTANSAFNPNLANNTASNGILSWSVSKISDTSGNYMTFTYTENTGSGTQVLSEIDYTGNGTTVQPYASVKFTYEVRTDSVSGYRAGRIVASTQRLKQIASYYGTTVARTYVLGYESTGSGPTSRSRLKTITETGSDGTSFAPLTFDYQSNSPGWQTQSSAPWVPPTSTVTAQGFNNQPTQYGTGYIDLDGDGRADFVQNYWDVNTQTTTAHAWLNRSTGWVKADGDAGDPADFRPPYHLGYSNDNDSSTRFVDLNGDGRPDIVWNHKDGNGVTESGAYENTGSGWTNAPTYTPPFTLAEDKANPIGARFLDLDGDGRVDLIATGTGNVRLNSGSGWNSASQWSAPCDLTHGVAFVDVNGDGLPDIVQNWYGGGSTESGIWLNTGNGWSAKQNIPAGFPLLNAGDSTGWGSNAPMGSEFVDLNGDGLVDVIARNDAAGNTITPQYWLNTGGTFVKATGTAYNPPVELRHDHESTGVAFIDVNGDGLADLVQSYQGSTPVVYYNTGSGWGTATTGSEALQATLYTSGWHNQNETDFVDIDGDGIVDQCGSWTDNGSHQAAVRNLSNPTQDRLIKVTNGFGVAAQVVYKPLTDSSVYTKGTGATYPDMDVIAPMQVVSQVKNDDGAGGTYDIDYSYGVFRMNADRGPLGFQWMKAVDSRTSIASTTWFRQDFPFIGMPYLAETVAGNGTVLSATSTTLQDRLLNSQKTHLPYAQLVVQKSHDLDNSYVGGTSTTTTIDDSGNATNVTVDGINDDNSENGFHKITDSTYSDDATKWLLGRLQTSTVTSQASGQTDIVRRSSYLYDGTTGLLTDEAVEPPLIGTSYILTADYTAVSGYGVNTLRTHYEYDAFGNKTAARVCGVNVTVDSNGVVTKGTTLQVRSTTTLYDSNGRFPQSTTNALSQTETYNSYDQALGVVIQMTGPNHLSTSWQYDGFGRKTHEARADTTATDYRRKWAASADTVTPSGALYQIETESTGAAPSIAFYDSFGRTIRSLGINGSGEIVYQDTVYDSIGRAYKKSAPFRNDGKPVYWTQTPEADFDVLSRPLLVRIDDDESSSGYVETAYAYSGLVITATDPKGRKLKTTKNSEGWVMKVERNADAATSATDYSAVTYEYDPLGEVTSTTAAGVQTTIHYDQRGRKDTMTDPDMGTWLYRYNAFGELIWQRDAKNQIVTMGYDALGRMTSRTETEGNSTWTYDSTWVGKLGGVISPGYSESYGYDQYGRPSTVTRNINGTNYTVGQTYDADSRPLNTTYPTGFQTLNKYNAFGFVKEVRRSDSGFNTIFWEADGYSVDGRVNSEIYGNGIINDRVYSPATGRLEYAAIDPGFSVGDPSQSHSTPYSIQDLFYGHDAVGNVITRRDGPTGRNESFQYDGLDRLTDYSLSGTESATAHVDYDQAGNITNKTGLNGLGSYVYDFVPTGRSGAMPHAVHTAGGNSYTYDADGNMTGGAGRTIGWTSFNQVQTVSDGNGHSSTFTFDAAHQRVKQVATVGGVSTTTIYVGAIFEQVTSGSVVQNKNYVFAPTGRIAVCIETSNNPYPEVDYFHQDGLGSITAITDQYGFVVKRFAFDPWGKRLTIDNTTLASSATTSADNGGFTRGFTDHEHLDDLGLVHMNGRVYDPLLGRFLSADPNVGDNYDSQEYNRYSYLGNNPLGGTDPSGFFSLKDAVKIVAVVAIGVITAGAALYAYAAAYTVGFASFGGALSCIAGGGFITVGEAIVAGAAGGFASGFAGSLLNGGSIGDAFKAGVIGGALGGITGGITYGIGSISGDLGVGGTAAAHGVTQGLANEAVGGDFRHGFYAGAASSLLAPGISKVSNEEAVQVAAAAVVGGTASALGGGKFGNGAVSGAFTYMFNWASHSPFDVHRKALFEAIKTSDGKFTREDAREMIHASHDMDRLKQWNQTDTEYVHGLWCPEAGYSRETAMDKWYSFVHEHFQNAVDLAAAGQRGKAMYELGLAMHAVQDPTSPSHFGFKIYSAAEINHPFTNGDSLSHMAHELQYPGNNSALFRATQGVLNQFSAGRMTADPLSYGHD